jgi:hypothetical protein
VAGSSPIQDGAGADSLGVEEDEAEDLGIFDLFLIILADRGLIPVDQQEIRGGSGVERAADQDGLVVGS